MATPRFLFRVYLLYIGRRQATHGVKPQAVLRDCVGEMEIAMAWIWKIWTLGAACSSSSCIRCG